MSDFSPLKSVFEWLYPLQNVLPDNDPVTDFQAHNPGLSFDNSDLEKLFKDFDFQAFAAEAFEETASSTHAQDTRERESIDLTQECYSSDGEEDPVPTETGSEAKATADQPAGSENAQPAFAIPQPVPSAETLGDHEPAVESDTDPYSTDEETPTLPPEHAATGCVHSLGVKDVVIESMYRLVSGTVKVETLEFFLAKAEAEGWDKQFIDVATLQWEVGHNVLIQPNVVALALGMIVDGLRAPCLNGLNRFMYRLKEEYCMKELLMLRIPAYDSAQWRLVKVHGGVHCFNECKNKLYLKGWVPNLSLRGRPKYRVEVVRDPVKGFCVLFVEPMLLAAEEFVMEYVGVVTLYPAISSSYVAKVEQDLYIDSSDLGNMARFMNTADFPDEANCAYYTEVVGPVRLVYIYTTKAIDARDGPVELLTFYGENAVVEAEDLGIV
ncbi:hypothetical protein CYMTET_9248 [Cymbomonas tetramitiformis]|uniref:SET domain-containing protein n=1 Tax=Cymbomonas tetramitiformis TaxID=36881 RepID=A0AAE0LFP2_9CHLO|nr:hypothetical protein CYMTET_9248 [Cymbomonas tetramitiformis]